MPPAWRPLPARRLENLDTLIDPLFLDAPTNARVRSRLTRLRGALLAALSSLFVWCLTAIRLRPIRFNSTRPCSPNPHHASVLFVAIMFFLKNMERRVTLHPSYFGRNMHDLVTSKLLKDVEGTCAGSYYIISIMDTFDISEGKILPSNGLAEFTVGYRAVVWRPFKGETVDAVVYSINPQGFFAQAGPLRLFVSAHVR